LVFEYANWQHCQGFFGTTFQKSSTIARPSKSYPNWDFLFENAPSGNPAQLSFETILFRKQHLSYLLADATLNLGPQMHRVASVRRITEERFL
jgi:hypothetical protein